MNNNKKEEQKRERKKRKRAQQRITELCLCRELVFIREEEHFYRNSVTKV
jgi:hypothetical protein